MQQQSSSKKTIIILAVIIVLALIIYFYFSGTPNDSASSTLAEQPSQESVDAEIAGARVLSLLNQISALKIDAAFFEDPTYKSLVDYSIEIPEQNIGRPNPFAPLSGAVSSVPKTGR